MAGICGSVDLPLDVCLHLWLNDSVRIKLYKMKLHLHPEYLIDWSLH